MHVWPCRSVINETISSLLVAMVLFHNSLVSLENEVRTTTPFSGFNKTAMIKTIAKETKQEETNEEEHLLSTF